jgi:hypothetical protein
MSDQDTSGLEASEADDERVDRSVQTDSPAEPASPEAGTASGALREDDRNEDVPDSPAPNPEDGTQGAEDDPQAD